ncbi:hypothetical protein RB620_09025 [Paenibacillus sp. LHD-117]|uniref:hypothetical protein n=1 Tax=Paenibacillus sp. LHD-117 TaxID=3071412 RepID=UPI0027E21138|nr:hypothetical protein [Paenibacillus sp. LHD-117]MDQ6419573.1 hypothetical protein [Paenibacillus sp. LHD-117]
MINEIDHIESVRGKLNDFQLMLAVSRAKDSMGVLGWERRQTVNSILERYSHIYREYGREHADDWVEVTFGLIVERSYAAESDEAEEITASPDPEIAASASEEEDEVSAQVSLRMQEISSLIVVKESELLQLYREFYMLSQQDS